jgi:predicted MPP superfamily phosphohydrolase
VALILIYALVPLAAVGLRRSSAARPKGPRRQTIGCLPPGSTAREERTMRIAAISDVHGNLPALRAALADIRMAKPDAIVSCGDLAAGPLPDQTIELIRSVDIPVHYVRRQLRSRDRRGLRRPGGSGGPREPADVGRAGADSRSA